MMGKGAGSLFRALAAAPVQAAAGMGTPVASHALGYEHPATVVTPLAVSEGLNHPSPPSIVAEGVGAGNDSVGRVGTGPVAVYVGSTSALGTRPIEVGGHRPKLAKSAASITPSPPPV